MAYGSRNPYAGMGAAGGGYSGPGMGQNWYYGQGGSNQGGGYGRLTGAGYRNPYAGGGLGGQGYPGAQMPGQQSQGWGSNWSYGYPGMPGQQQGYGGSGGRNPDGSFYGQPGSRRTYLSKSGGGIGGGFGGAPGRGFGAREAQGMAPHGSMSNPQQNILRNLGPQFAPMMQQIMMLQNLGYDPAQFGLEDIQSTYYGTGNAGRDQRMPGTGGI